MSADAPFARRRDNPFLALPGATEVPQPARPSGAPGARATDPRHADRIPTSDRSAPADRPGPALNGRSDPGSTTAHGPGDQGAFGGSLALGGGASGGGGWGSGGGLGTAAARGEPSAVRRLHALLRGRYLLTIILCLLGATTGAFVAYKTQTPQFTSSGLIELKLVVQSMSRDDRVMLMANQFMGNQVNIIQTQRVMDSALSSREWQQTKRGNTAEVQADFRENLKVDIVPGSTYLRVTYTDPDPSVARAAVGSVIRAYQAVYGEVNTTDTRAKLNFIEQARTQKTNQINEKRDQILRLAEEYGSSNLEAYHNAKLGSMVAVETELATARATLATLDNEATGSATRPSVLESNNLSAEEIAALDPTVRDLLRMVREGDFQLKRLLGRLPPGNKSVVEAQRDLELMQTQLDDAVRAFRSRFVAIRVDPSTGAQLPISADTLAQFRDRVKYLETRYERTREETTRLGQRKLQIQQLDYDIERLKGEIDGLSRNIENLYAENLMGGDLRVLDIGSVPTAPSQDKRKQMAVMGLAGGGLIPLGLLLLIGLIDSRYRYSDDHSDNLPHVPLLGILPDLPNLSTDPQQATIAAHCVHQIRTMLEIAAETQGRRALAVTSPSPSDGKTSLSLALGLSFAAAGTRTLLIDCDVIGGGLSARMNQTHPEGTLEAVAAKDLARYVVPTDVANLAILPVGASSNLHPTILSPGALGRLIATAKASYDIVIVDTGPVLGSVEASPACAACDATILVVSRGRQKAQVARSLDHLVSIGARLAGVVFNRASHPDFQRSTSRLALRQDATATSNGANGLHA